MSDKYEKCIDFLGDIFLWPAGVHHTSKESAIFRYIICMLLAPFKLLIIGAPLIGLVLLMASKEVIDDMRCK